MWKIAVADTAEDHLTLLKDALKAYFQETHRVFSVTSYTDLTFLPSFYQLIEIYVSVFL